MKLSMTFPRIGRRVMLLNARIVRYEKAHTNILLGIEDVTVQRDLEREKDDLLRQKEVLLDEVQHRVATDGGSHAQALFPVITYQPVRVTMRDGKVINGVLRNEDSFTLQVFGSDNQLYLLDREKLKEVYYVPKSLMPTDVDKRLTPAEFQDLLAYLTRLAVPVPQVPRGGGE